VTRTGLTTVKIDAETHRLIGDLAHLLGRTRGEVVRDAVNAFAVWREAVLDDGAEASSGRRALASARHLGRLASGDLATSAAERAERSRIGVARVSEAMLLRLTIHERVEVRRAELEDAFGELGARNPRLADPRDHGREHGSIVILVDLDDPSRFPFGELVSVALEILSEIVYIAATNAPYPSLFERGRLS
jgi:predicted transcriptional regulator